MINVFAIHIMKKKTGAAPGAVEVAADRENTIANGLGLQPARRKTPKQAAGGINFQCLGAWPTGLPPSGRGEDLPLQRFDAPAPRDELARQPVQQFRMRWTCTVFTEIVRGVHQADAE